jgi:hypothetical protein
VLIEVYLLVTENIVFIENNNNKWSLEMQLLQKALTLSFRIVFLTIPILFSQHVLASKGGEISDQTRVVSLAPKDLPALNGRNPRAYSLAAVKNGRLSPIPSQIDERRESGFIYMKEKSQKDKKDDPLVGKELLFDGNDELLFMFKDAGERLKSLMQVDGSLVSEIELDNYAGQKRYVYLVKDAVRENETHYVRFSSELGRVETDFYALKVDPKNAFMWEEFYYDSFVGAKVGRPIDTIKLRMYSNVLAAVPLNLSNKNIIAKVVAEKSGPIRSTTEYKVNVTFAKSPIMNFDLQIVHHEQSFSYNSRVEIPAIRRRFVSKAAMNVSTDFIDLYGAEIRTSSGPSQPAIVDGQTSEIEKEMMAAPFKINEKNWIWVGTKHGFSMLNNFIVETDEEIPMNVYYEEDKDVELAPEYFKGQMPMVGFFMQRTPLKGFMQITNKTSMYADPIDIDPAKFAELTERDLNVKVIETSR